MATGGRRLLQQGAKPRKTKGSVNPDAPIAAPATRHRSTEVSELNGPRIAMPAETFQYDIVYEAFRADEDFWHHWNVVDAARNSLDSGVSHDNASIRVVMNLPSSQRLFPTAYTPGFQTVPFRAIAGTALEMLPLPGRPAWTMRNELPQDEGETMPTEDFATFDVDEMKLWCEEHPECVGFSYCPDTRLWEPKRKNTGFDAATAIWIRGRKQFYYMKQRAGLRREEKSIKSLPPGFSVALEVHILEEARIMLAHQRSFRNGLIDPQYKWLDDIVRKFDGEDEPTKPNPRAKQKSNRPRPALLAGPAHPESDLRPPVGSLQVDCSEPGFSEGLLSYSDMYSDGSQVMKHVAQGKNQVYAENTLISAFGHARLPPREDGNWDGPATKSTAALDRERLEGETLDARLDDLLGRPEPQQSQGANSSLVAGRLDRA